MDTSRSLQRCPFFLLFSTCLLLASCGVRATASPPSSVSLPPTSTSYVPTSTTTIPVPSTQPVALSLGMATSLTFGNNSADRVAFAATAYYPSISLQCLSYGPTFGCLPGPPPGPPQGTQYVGVALTLTDQGNQSDRVAEQDFTIMNQSGQSYPPAYISSPAIQCDASFGTASDSATFLTDESLVWYLGISLIPGQTAHGCLIFEVPTGSVSQNILTLDSTPVVTTWFLQ